MLNEQNDNTNTTDPQVYNGYQWITIDQQQQDEDFNNENNIDMLPPHQQRIPLPPIDTTTEEDNNSTIFISIASFRDGERCGATLKSIYENAQYPNRIYIGLAEQNAPQDLFCIEVYCQYYRQNKNDLSSSLYQRRTIHTDMTQLVVNQTLYNECPYIQNIRMVRVHDYKSYGPIYTRSLIRKVLGNEDYCFQIDAHSIFTHHWDTIVIKEWKLIQNEFGILSAVPHAMDEQYLYNNTNGIHKSHVSRQCLIQFHPEYHYPDYANPVDGMVRHLKRPLLSYGWSSGFAFGKCHMEESVPYDNQLYYTTPMIEQFSKYVRYFTRGYDTYTPTQNIIYHNTTIVTPRNLHGQFSKLYVEKQKQQKELNKKHAIRRIKIPLNIPVDDDHNKDHPNNNAIPVFNNRLHANLGVYGLGRRRTIEQLNEFMNIQIDQGIGNNQFNNTGPTCTGLQWIPYDMSISPVEHLYNNPSNLDPQPEYPLRTNLIYYQQVQHMISSHHKKNWLEEENITVIDRSLLHAGPIDAIESSSSLHHEELMLMKPLEEHIEMPSFYILFFVWMIGLSIWYLMFLSTSSHHHNNARMKSHNHHNKKDAVLDDVIDKEV